MANRPPRYPNPHVIPSQNPATGRGSPGAPDMRGINRIQRAHPVTAQGGQGTDFDFIPTPNEENTVLSVWDSRPINSRDFLFTSRVAPILDGTSRSFAFTFNVPNARTLFLRHWTLSLVFVTAGAPIINADGTSNVIMALDFLRNGISLIDYSNMSYNTLPFGGLSNDCFLAWAEGDEVTFQGTIDPAVSADITIADGQIEMTGVTNLATGRDLGLESATQYPVNVRVKNTVSIKE